MDELYKKVPPQRPDAQIRLLRMLPHPEGPPDAFTDSPAEYELNVYDLDPERNTVPEYIAISYTWGDKSPTRPIVVNRYRIPVRAHCADALEQLRRDQPAAALWIDSVCIHQDKIQEKNKQVALMGTIYENAKSVATCLGPQSDDAFSAIDKANNANMLNAHRMSMAALEALGNMRYFNRIWIKQELILAADITLYIAQHKVSWANVERLVSAASEQAPSATWLPDGERAHGKIIERVINVCEDRELRHSASASRNRGGDEELRSQGLRRPAIIDLMLRHADADCADPRDKIYALLSLLPPQDPARGLFQVDYGLSPLRFIGQAVCSLGVLRAERAAEVDLSFWARKMVGWFAQDDALYGDVYKLMLGHPQLPFRGCPKLELYVEDRLNLWPSAGSLSLVQEGRHRPRAFLSPKVSISINQQSREDGHNFVAKLAQPQDTTMQYKIVEYYFMPRYKPKAREYRYYLVSDCVGVGDVLGRVSWSKIKRSQKSGSNWPNDEAGKDYSSYSVSHAILRRSQNDSLRFHSWALPLKHPPLREDGDFKSGRPPIRNKQRAPELFGPRLFRSSKEGNLYFSFRYPHQGRMLGSQAGPHQPAPGSVSVVDEAPALVADMHLPRGPPDRIVESDGMLQLRHEDVLELSLSETYSFQLLHPRDGTDRFDANASGPPWKEKAPGLLKNCSICCCACLCGCVDPHVFLHMKPQDCLAGIGALALCLCCCSR